MTLDRWLPFCLACVALVATPGPNVLYLVSRTVVQGRGAGFVSLAGTFCGSGLHVLAAAVGLPSLLVAVPLAYEATRWAGAAYLGWLAFSTWRSPAVGVAPSRPMPRALLLWQGFLTGVLNPKVAAFELAFFPQFLDPARGHLWAQSLVLSATQLSIALAGDSTYILVAATVGRWLASYRPFVRASRRALASVFAVLALCPVWGESATGTHAP